MKTLKQFIEEQMEVHPENVAIQLASTMEELKNETDKTKKKFLEAKIAALRVASKNLGIPKGLN